MKTKCRFSFYSRTFGLLPDEITILVLNQPILNLRPKHPNSTLYVPHHLADVMKIPTTFIQQVIVLVSMIA